MVLGGIVCLLWSLLAMVLSGNDFSISYIHNCMHLLHVRICKQIHSRMTKCNKLRNTSLACHYSCGKNTLSLLRILKSTDYSKSNYVHFDLWYVSWIHTPLFNCKSEYFDHHFPNFFYPQLLYPKLNYDYNLLDIKDVRFYRYHVVFVILLWFIYFT